MNDQRIAGPDRFAIGPESIFEGLLRQPRVPFQEVQACQVEVDLDLLRITLDSLFCFQNSLVEILLSQVDRAPEEVTRPIIRFPGKHLLSLFLCLRNVL